jgi:hypothetical protein
MIAHDLIDSIFSRPQTGVAGNVRVITRAQLDFLTGLIGEDEEGGAVQRGLNGSFVWMPSGRHKYVITVDLRGNRHTLTRLSNIAAAASGSLF